MTSDVLVLGAGMVGVSAALHLQKRGRSVVLVDRRGAAEETSYGNAGLIQREAIVPYGFPREFSKLWRYALNMLPEAHHQWSSLPWNAVWLFKYWWHSRPERLAASARAAFPLVERCIVEHRALMEEAGIADMIRETGYLKLFRTNERYDQYLREQEEVRREFGVNFEQLDPAALRKREPYLTGNFVGGLLMLDPVSVTDPSAVGKAYAKLFVQRGGKFITADARTLEPTTEGWQVHTVDGPVKAREAVIALGPWSDDVLKPLGIRVPLWVKRGYHVHFRPRGDAVLNGPIFDIENGFVLAPMTRGIRLTTGAEFAHRDAPKTPVQLEKLEPIARATFPLGERVENKPWMGSRPCLPDMLPMIGPIPGHRGLWADFGHHHLGFTLGPATGRLLAEMMTGEPTFTDPWPYRVDRFR
ncbi:MAG: FAD-dependent oxidoreductase [Pseudomonadota bacterium]|jgi:D-amino-acid dehydrogenase|nr:MAG: amino acid dehydrogenase [Pseudomonadota bacterium]HEX5600825.1 FAD-dependent oxidoreductase [Hyphomicrobiaceae bacterium]